MRRLIVAVACCAVSKKGFLQREIAKAAYTYQREIDNKERIIVGVNGYVLENEQIDIPILKIDESVAEMQRQSIKKAKSIRDQDKVTRTLNDLRQACRDNKNTMPFIIDCVRQYSDDGGNL